MLRQLAGRLSASLWGRALIVATIALALSYLCKVFLWQVWIPWLIATFGR